MRPSYLIGAALCLVPLPSFASDCPDLKLSETLTQQYCDEFRDLLYGPYKPNSDRDHASEEAQKLEFLLKSDSLWGEVYRSDPKRTLELIKRIRDSGGLSTN